MADKITDYQLSAKICYHIIERYGRYIANDIQYLEESGTHFQITLFSRKKKRKEKKYPPLVKEWKKRINKKFFSTKTISKNNEIEQRR